MPTEARVARVALTAGEPAGIGPDLCAMVASRDSPAELVLIGDGPLLRARAARLGLRLDLRAFDPDTPPRAQRAGQALLLQSVAPAHPPEPGELDVANVGHVLDSLRRACDGCLAGRFDAMVTGPVHKGIINAAGSAFSGHTEFLAAHCGGTPLMLLAVPGLRVALATTHLPLRAVAQALSAARLERAITTLDAGLKQDFGIAAPRILVCGLNPHAGEGGHLGDEEQELIIPLLEQLRGRGIHALGPFPADSLFVPARLAEADAVLAMYHDQGLPVLKHLGFGRAVNITLGLPIIRTSVDHGTALPLAGTGQADPGSLLAAINTAITMAEMRRHALAHLQGHLKRL